MSAAWGHLIGVLTVMIMLAFVGIWVWAWLPYHKRDFDRLARLPMSDDEDTGVAPARHDP
ncbi:MAG TPA: cbb3-type cytochrome c oxidase subunit 3 [Povalibacter sp.]|nr:cbb3-type cytochrome c oxidase subunit 3 [Povalibacter sp.]